MRDDASPVFEDARTLALIKYVGKKAGEFGHNYFRTSLAVASNLILIPTGAENGRPPTRRGPFLTWVTIA